MYFAYIIAVLAVSTIQPVYAVNEKEQTDKILSALQDLEKRLNALESAEERSLEQAVPIASPGVRGGNGRGKGKGKGNLRPGRGRGRGRGRGATRASPRRATSTALQRSAIPSPAR